MANTAGRGQRRARALALREGDAAPSPGDYHDWAEFHLDGAWRLVDAQKRFWWTAPLRYVRFAVFPFASEYGPGGFRRFKTRGAIEAVLSAGQALVASSR